MTYMAMTFIGEHPYSLWTLINGPPKGPFVMKHHTHLFSHVRAIRFKDSTGMRDHAIRTALRLLRSWQLALGRICLKSACRRSLGARLWLRGLFSKAASKMCAFHWFPVELTPKRYP